MLATVIAAAAIAHGRQPDLSWARALTWQAGVWAIWAPVGLLLWVVLLRPWRWPRIAVAVFALGWASVPAHAVWAAWLDLTFSGARAGLDVTALERGPVDMLAFTALAAALFGQVQRRRAGIEARRADDLLRQLTAPPSEPAGPPTLLVAVGRRKLVAPLDQIERIEAAGNYAEVFWNGHEGLIRATLDDLTQALKAEGFVRAHRSLIVNLGHVREMRGGGDGRAELVMTSGTAVGVGRRYREDVIRRLGRT